MKLFYKTVIVIICLLLFICVACSAKGVSDTDNHIACDNSNYKIPTTRAVRLDESKG